MKLSIVTTLYQSSPYIAEFCARSSSAAKELVGDFYEIIMVNDGSPDDSHDIAISLAKTDHHITVVDLSRNFGHHKAMMTGLAEASGEQIFLIDSDLEEEPEWLIPFSRQLAAENSDVVFGIQNKRRGSFFEKITGNIFYKSFRLLTGIQQPDNIITARIMTRRYVNALLLHEEREINIGGLWAITGFKQCTANVNKHSNSPTSYSISKKISHFVNAVTSFSSLPLRATFYSGLLISVSALCYISFLILRFCFVASPPNGYTSIIVSVWLFSGLIILFLGIQGIYISKIFSEVKHRPYTIVRNIYKRNQGND